MKKLIEALTMEVDETCDYNAIQSNKIQGAVLNTLIKQGVISRDEVFIGIVESQFTSLKVASYID